MKLLLIRHAAAAEPEDFGGSDLDRPLTDEGRKKARRAFKTLAVLHPDVQLILTSRARRAIETGALLADCLGNPAQVASERLNPGCGAEDLVRALAEWPALPEAVAVVGHEPDLSHILGHVAGAGALRVRFKKAACAVAEVNRQLKGELQALLPPAALCAKDA
ncbi:MAG TPA: histidine phosphatase family protein [Kiritimatiellia bacterium]|nr:histidine phosphatase family protein [Kiritimatiellia bacterium]HRZ12807.1 histidine phosphatase family protein [Kiritimatiellia bacterium]HSA18241.1 histidine phosphatase family protein [Kiritimatiellia bacterium]